MTEKKENVVSEIKENDDYSYCYNPSLRNNSVC